MVKKSKLKESVAEVLEYKAQGWTDAQIRKQTGLSESQYRKRLEYISENRFFEREAKSICMETVHRMYDVRQRAFVDYQSWKKEKNFAAAVAALKVVKDIDIEIPKTCLLFGWKHWEQTRIPGGGNSVEDLSGISDDELQTNYRKLIGSAR